MDISRETLNALYTGFKKHFQTGFAGVQPQYKQVATVVPSRTAAETYAWLGDMPRMREWVGDRVIRQLGAGGGLRAQDAGSGIQLAGCHPRRPRSAAPAVGQIPVRRVRRRVLSPRRAAAVPPAGRRPAPHPR